MLHHLLFHDFHWMLNQMQLSQFPLQNSSNQLILLQNRMEDNLYIVYNLDFDLVSDDIGHDQCIRGHLDLEAAGFGVNPFHKDSPCGRRFDQIIAHSTAIDNQDINLPDGVDDSSVSDWYAGFDLGEALDQRLMVNQQPDLMEELLDDCLQLLSTGDSPGIQKVSISTQTEPEPDRKSRKFMKRMN